MNAKRKATVQRSRRAGRDIVSVLRSEKETLHGFGVRRIGLFGSHAWGESTERSDVDLLVEFEKPSFDNFMKLTSHLERLLGRRVDVLTPDGLAGIRVKEVAESIKRSVVYV